MKRRLLLGALALFTSSRLTAASLRSAFLSISGRIGRVNNQSTLSYDFSESAFLRLPAENITTSTPWTPTSLFSGPLLLDVMHAAGVTSGTLTCKTLDDYSAPIPWDDLERYGVILAHSQNGHRLSEKRWGPLWTIYPRDQHFAKLSGPVAESRFIWQVNRIDVRG